ncbi:glycoside hydrolase family 3 C-terminal domain-containing protein [Sphingomonas psychrotolerans]|uniref:Glycoside hydrolase family 3 C-terminal domain-containing protein n=1 Tax=Sphingomonas psychrotolerans TaxID=1327635 RepID=A0ABU3N5L9_9SPHN|nr:glycoside hydrolase family 3 C-terminal domain-containing protein [Sphingomonas psychrotolerans]MDT8759144.1 glycoside hydrolase family 3 C-terminal domain-containing protein [Sphingomonas psychrotolerans]
MKRNILLALALAGSGMTAIGVASAPGLAAPAREDRPWMNTRLPAERRAALLLARMTRDEKLTLVFGQFATDFPFAKYKAPAGSREGSAGYIAGVPRLGIPAQWQADAGIGVATQGGAARKRERTALPSNLAVAASWSPEVAFAGGAMIGAEARASGFNVMLAGGVNLAREPRNGRNFEYGGEDPLLAGTIVGAQIAGVQSNRIISTVKHFAVNDQETDRNAGNSVIDPRAARQSDLLAFELAIEKGDPGSVMCAYNRVNGPFSCENPWLLRDVLRRDWGFRGYVMSDWGAVHSTAPAIAAGLDQESGFPFDRTPYFREELKKALADGKVQEAQLDTMVSRILYAMFRHGLFDRPVTEAPFDLPASTLARNAAISRAAAEESIVLLKNQGDVLPLAATAKRILVVGGHADKGVIAGGGSSLVYPKGGNAVPDIEPKMWPGPVMFYPSAPLDALRRQRPDARIDFVDGRDPAAAAALAQSADVVLVFATQWAGESFDVSLSLKDGQDALIESVAAANPRTVVVLETGGAVLTPWADKVAGIVEAWFPGTAGGEAVANVLTGKVNPSGHLPITFPRGLAELPHPAEPAKGDVHYTEGAAIGYKWYDLQNSQPAFPFGHGLSYTRFAYSKLAATALPGSIGLRFTVENRGKLRGKAVAQVYAAGAGWEAPRRLAGFRKLDLAPGRSQQVSLTIDPRLLASYDEPACCWRVAPGSYRFTLGGSSAEVGATATLTLSSAQARRLKGACKG